VRPLIAEMRIYIKLDQVGEPELVVMHFFQFPRQS
jgi:hypothetical protein